jgi:putative protease
MTDQKVGEITHYFDRIGVAVLKVIATLKVGDKIKITGRGNEFEMIVESMQVEHKNIKTAEKGDDVGLKVEQAVKKGDEVFKLK